MAAEMAEQKVESSALMLANCWAALKAGRMAGAREWSSAAKMETRTAETSVLVSAEH
jgi:hypothetical protein